MVAHEDVAAALVADLTAVWGLVQEGLVLLRAGHKVPKTIICRRKMLIDMGTETNANNLFWCKLERNIK